MPAAKAKQCVRSHASTAQEALGPILQRLLPQLGQAARVVGAIGHLVALAHLKAAKLKVAHGAANRKQQRRKQALGL